MLKIKQLIAQNVHSSVLGINPAAELTVDELVGMLEYPPEFCILGGSRTHGCA